MQHPFSKEAQNPLEELSADEIARIQAERRADELYFYEYGLHASREEGREQGALLQSRSILTRVIQLELVPPAPQARIDGATKDESMAWLHGAVSGDSIDDVFR